MFKDKQFFEPLTSEELTREQEREIVNIRLLRILKEAKKVGPLNEIFNDFPLFMAFVTQAFIYNDAITTKFSVNFQLYHKTIVFLGTDQH